MISVCLGLAIAHPDLLLSLNLCIHTRLCRGQLANITAGTAPMIILWACALLPGLYKLCILHENPEQLTGAKTGIRKKNISH